VEYFPQLIIVLSFLLLYVPYIINELRKIEDPFKIKNLLYITVIAMCIGVVGYLVSSLVPKYNCTPEFIRIWPTDWYLLKIYIYIYLKYYINSMQKKKKKLTILFIKIVL